MMTVTLCARYKLFYDYDYDYIIDNNPGVSLVKEIITVSLPVQQTVTR